MRRVLGLAVLALAVVQEGGPALAQQSSVQAGSGSVAIGGNVSGSTITVGIPPEQLAALIRITDELSASQRDRIAQLQKELDLNQRQVRAALTILGEANVSLEQLPVKIVEVAERFKALQTTAAAQPGDDPEITALKAEAQKAIEASDLAKADDLLAKVEQVQTVALDRLALNAAETSAQRGKVALTRLRYTEAAQHFANAAARVPSGHDDKRLAYLDQEAEALYRQGRDRGDNIAARSAIERNRQILELRPRERVPLLWAQTQNNLGKALGALGQRESGTARLEQAVQAYRAALEEGTRERSPLLWATTQANLGEALQTLGERESGTVRLEQAVEAYRLALQEFSALHAPYYRAMTEQNLSNVCLLHLASL